MPKKLEKKLVEDYIAQNLQELGWKFVESQELDRPGIQEPLLIKNLKEAILRINKDLGIGEEELKKGNKKFLHFLWKEKRCQVPFFNGCLKNMA